MKELTKKDYWENGYERRMGLLPVNLVGFRNLCSLKVYDLKKSIGLHDKNIVEIGGGGSAWLAFLATKYPTSRFSVIDYSEIGCRILSEFAEKNHINNINVYCRDFNHSHDLYGKYDLVYSHGVVEHFTSLPDVLKTLSEFLRPNGKMLNIIPNLGGILGNLTRFFNRHVYDMHIPHDKNSFIKGHQEAGLLVQQAGYVCSNNFGLLSTCLPDETGIKWKFYKSLTKLTKLIWAFEYYILDLPVSRLMSPYIYAVSIKL